VAVSPTLTSLSFPIWIGRPGGAEAEGASGTVVLPEGETEQADRPSGPPTVVAAVPSNTERRGRDFSELMELSCQLGLKVCCAP
jgi:hypothetical protein